MKGHSARESVVPQGHIDILLKNYKIRRAALPDLAIHKSSDECKPELLTGYERGGGWSSRPRIEK